MEEEKKNHWPIGGKTGELLFSIYYRWKIALKMAGKKCVYNKVIFFFPSPFAGERVVSSYEKVETGVSFCAGGSHRKVVGSWRLVSFN